MVNWNCSMKPSYNYNSVIYGVNGYVAVGNDIINVSTDGASWTDISPTVNGLKGINWTSIIYGGNGYVAVSSSGKVMKSDDVSSSSSWIDISPTTDGLKGINWTSIIYGSNGYVAFSSSGKVMKSDDASSSSSWIDISSNEGIKGINWRLITYGIMDVLLLVMTVRLCKAVLPLVRLVGPVYLMRKGLKV
jgi:hypothetical protein